MLAFVVVGDERDTDWFALGNAFVAFSGGEADVNPALGHAEFLAGQGAGEFVYAATGGIGDAVMRAVGERFAAGLPFAPIGAAEVFPNFITGTENDFRFAGIAGNRRRAEMCLVDFGGALRRVDDGFAHRGGVHDAGHAVVVGGGNGIELMIVAPGAGDREPKESFADDVELVVDHVGLGFGGIGGAVENLSKPKEIGGQRRFENGAVFGETRVRKKIAGDVFADKGVVGKILIESADDVVAVLPGVELVVVVFVAIGFGEANEIEPVAAPSFAVVRGGEEAIDDAGVGCWRAIGFEGGDLRGGGRKAGEIERNAAQPGAAGGFRSASDLLLCQLGVEKPIDRSIGGRNWERLERPKFAALFKVNAGRILGRNGRVLAGVWRAHADPGFEVGDNRVWQLAGRRHTEMKIGIRNGFPKSAFFRLAGDNNGTGVTAFAKRGTGIQL